MKKDDEFGISEEKAALIDVVQGYIIEAIECSAASAVGRKAEEFRMIEKENKLLKEHIKLLNAERKANQYEAIMAKLNDTVSSIEWKMNQSMAQIKRLVK